MQQFSFRPMKKALIQLHIAVLLWGFTGVLGRLISLDAAVIVWYRMLLTALFMLAILLYSRKWISVPISGIKKLASIGALMAIHWVAFYAAIKYSNASIALVCLATVSVFTSILDPILSKTKFNFKELTLGLIALSGVYLIYHFQHFYGKGILLGICAALLSSIFTILNKRIANDYPSRTMVFYEMTTGFMVITLLAPFAYFYFPHTMLYPQQESILNFFKGFPNGFVQLKNDWIWLIILALCCTVWAQVLALNALKKLSSFTVTLSVNMEPVYGIILAILIYREDLELGIGFFAGMTLICLSVVLQMRSLILENKKRKLAIRTAITAPPNVANDTNESKG